MARAAGWREWLRCPACGEGLETVDRGEGQCPSCQERYRVDGNVVQWASAESAAALPARRALSDYWAVARYRLDPFASPHSPLAWLSRRRIEGYYERALRDASMARAWAARYLSGIALPGSARVLDHGCGRGRFAAFLTRLGHRVVGQDVTAHPWWAHLPEVGFAVVPPERARLPWRPRTFDLVLDWGVIGHIPAESLARHAEEVFAALEPGGTWAVYEANATGLGVHLSRRHYGRLHSLDAFRDRATAAGFAVSRVVFEDVQSPVFPRAFDYLATHLSPRGFVLGTGGSVLDRFVPPRRRSRWLMHLQRPH